MTREEVKETIAHIGIFPAIRVADSGDALYAAETLYESGIRVAEITMTTPGAVDIIAELAKRFPDFAVGAGTVLDAVTAERCVDAGARFLTSTGLVFDVIEQGVKSKVVVVPGALTPSEVISAWKAGADFVKIFPAAAVGGDLYIRSLQLPLPHIPLIAAGGVNQQTWSCFRARRFCIARASASMVWQGVF
jgi:2-dehydro-3-deoxyphosphogluconate aldolase/(4S)-4-hydroxy-2-oxoglutarate aldolase